MFISVVLIKANMPNETTGGLTEDEEGVFRDLNQFENGDKGYYIYIRLR